MVKKIGVFSDIHADKLNLDLITRTFKQLGIDSSIFLGDAVYKVMADNTNAAMNKAEMIKEQLRQDSSLRKDVLNGYWSKKQLENYLNDINLGTTIAKKVAKAEYKDLKASLSGLDSIILGGNHDYNNELEEVFQEDYLNSQAKTLSGLNIMGFSGGGLAPATGARSITLGETQRDKKHQHEKWAKVLLNKDRLNYDIFVSHVPFTDGEGIEKENSTEQLKQFIKHRRNSRIENDLENDLPNVYMWGHRHGNATVRYDEELEGFVVLPGCASKNHNPTIPTFIISEFDEDNKLTGVQEYAIYCSLKGFSEVRQIGHYDVDQENKKVTHQSMDKIVIQENNLKEFADNLILDEKYKLRQKGIITNYETIKEDAQSLDWIVRQNISVMQHELEERANEITTIFRNVASNYVTHQDTDKAVDESLDQLLKLACDILKSDYETINNNPHETKYSKIAFIEQLTGVKYATIKKTLADKKVKTKAEIDNWSGTIVEEAKSNLGKKLQGFIFDGLKPEDYQRMAEIHMPECYERTQDIYDQERGWNLWMKSYQEGILTSDAIEASGAYKKKKDFKADKMNKKDIADLFGFELEEKPKQIDWNNVDNLPNEKKLQIQNMINNRMVEVIKEENNQEYLRLREDGTKTYLNDAFTNGLNYTPITEQEWKKKRKEEKLEMGQDIKKNLIPVIEEEGKRYAVKKRYDGKDILTLIDEDFGITDNDYTPMSLQEYQRRSLIQNHYNLLNNPPQNEDPFSSRSHNDIGNVLTPENNNNLL